MTDISEPIPLTRWCMFGSCVFGYLGCGKRIRTSAVVKKEDRVITTMTGSRYRLLDADKEVACTEAEMLQYMDERIAGYE